MPVAAVTLGGAVRVNSGSQITAAGRMLSSMTTYLITFSVSIRALTLVISLEVPAVVGMAIRGGQGFFTRFMPPYRLMGPGLVISTPTALAVSMLLPPPTATKPSTPAAWASAAASSTV